MPQSLNADQLLALYHQLEGGGEAPRERRVHPRTAAKQPIPASLFIGSEPAAVGASIRDLSRSGVGIISPRALAPGEQVGIAFRMPAGAVRATCRVANCRAHPDEGYIVGLAFVQVQRSQAPASDVGDAKVASDIPAGEFVAARDLMAGAELAHVEDVILRLRKALGSC